MNIGDIKEEIEHCHALVKEHKKVLRVLEQQSATLGIFTPPYIVIEINSKREAIQDLERKAIELQSTITTETDMKPEWLEDFDTDILNHYTFDIKNVRRIFKLVKALFPNAYKQELASIDINSLQVDPRLSGIWEGTWQSKDSPSEYGHIKLIIYHINDYLIGTATLSNSILSFFDYVYLKGSVKDNSVDIKLLIGEIPVEYVVTALVEETAHRISMVGQYTINEYDFGQFTIERPL